jgi:hypothetical protein
MLLGTVKFSFYERPFMKKYLAMWSGPRNISTAMMRSWENRPDCFVHDEAFYAHYLSMTDYEHPMKAEIIAAYENDWEKVAATLTGEIPEGKSIYFQKHMTHHMLPHIGKDWMLKLDNCFLIREPSRVILSFAKVIPNPELEQTGFPQQLELFRFVQQETGKRPPVLDAKDVLLDPRRALWALCDALGIPFMEEMLSWPAGKRESDGIWAKHWYASVEESTGFMPYQEEAVSIPKHLQALVDEAQAIYDEMADYRLIKAEL